MGRDDRSWNDDDRPSWRELDKRKDRSSHRRDDKPAYEGGKKQQVFAKTAALMAAKKLFVPKKPPEQLKAEQELEGAKSTAEFGPMAERFVETYGLTKDWHVQSLLAEAPTAKIAVPAIEALIQSAVALGETEKRAIASQLRILAMTGKSKIKAAAGQALEQIQL